MGIVHLAAPTTTRTMPAKLQPTSQILPDIQIQITFCSIKLVSITLQISYWEAHWRQNCQIGSYIDFFGDDAKKCKNQIFCKTPISQNLLKGKNTQDRTMC